MNSSIKDIVNSIITSILPKINSELPGVIKSSHLDPSGQLAHGQQSVGTINFEICQATVNANYNVQSMTGLSSFSIDEIQIKSLEGNSNGFTGTMMMSTFLRNNLSAQIGGNLDAKCGSLQQGQGISGSAIVSGVGATATGSIKGSIDVNSVIIYEITLSGISINYDNVFVSVDGTGVFDPISAQLKEAVTGLFKEQVREAISSAMTPLVNQEIEAVLPQRHSL